MFASSVFSSSRSAPSRLHAPAWFALRSAILMAILVVVALLIVRPQTGLTLVWDLAVPALPLLFVVAPGLWRQICPLAFANQLPRLLGLSRGLGLPKGLARHAYALAILSFTVLVGLRVVLFNASGSATAAMAVLALAAAFGGGLLVKGKAGWCGTFCPLGPIQRDYGHAPLLAVDNSWCVPCVGCQKGCYDLNPRATLFNDLDDEDPRHAGQHRFFMAMMPGVVVGYFSQLPFAGDYLHYLLVYAAAILGSVGLYMTLTGFCGVSHHLASVSFASIAIAAFYWFCGPIMINGLHALAAFDAGPSAVWGIRATGGAVAVALFAQGIANGRRVAAARAAAARDDQTGGFEVEERHSGLRLRAKAGATLLSVLNQGGPGMTGNCRSGLCGSDPVTVIAGEANLSPPTPEEAATLKRLGVSAGVRLACCAQVRGPVVIDLSGRAAARRDDVPVIGLRGVPAERGARALEKRTAPFLKLASSSALHVVVIGNGIAGTTLAQALKERDAARFRLTLLSAETLPLYNRMALCSAVQKGLSAQQLEILPPQWTGSNDIALHSGTRVAAIDRQSRTLTTIQGEIVPWHRLVIATGAAARVPEPGFLARENAFVLRAMPDALVLSRYLAERRPRSAVVLGGGVLGIEAAEMLAAKGLSVTLVHAGAGLMERQLPAAAAGLLQLHLLARLGIQTRCNVRVTRFAGLPAVRAVHLDDGGVIQTDLVVACIGVVSNVALARACGLETGTGIRVDAQMRTSDPAIYAVGDVAEPAHGRIDGLWPVAIWQARAAACSIASEPFIEPLPRPLLHLKSTAADVWSLGGDGTAATDILASPVAVDVSWRVALAGSRVLGGHFVGPPGSGEDFAAVLRSRLIGSSVEDALRQGQLPKIHPEGDANAA